MKPRHLFFISAIAIWNGHPVSSQAQTKDRPYISEMLTDWGSEVTADHAWTEYPRPQMRRESWTNLNGHWDYAVTGEDQRQMPTQWDGQILVPFALESKLGGVQRLLHDDEALWYRRTFTAAPASDQRILLHFEAVDYRCEVWINGKSVGTHQGGNTPFAFEISSDVTGGENTLVVRLEDDTEGYQLHGKQVTNPRTIWYTQVSGIWQTVWLETVPQSFIADLTILTDADKGTIQVSADVEGESGTRIRVIARDGENQVADTTAGASGCSVQIDDAKLWSPASPYLYDLEIHLLDDKGDPIDRVESYAGIRSVGKRRDDEGHLRFTLNDEVTFHYGPLDQGWWPDGLLTPPSDEAMLSDIEYLKAAGFNMIRKHIKVEPRRYYYHCDRLGMMVWQDHVSASHKPKWTRLKPNPQDADWPEEHHQQFMVELESMIDTLENHPCIVMWVPFNEAWGQHRTMEVGKWTVERDPSRLVNIASGGNFWPVGDVVDQHSYPNPGFPFDQERFTDFVKVIGEFGGHGFVIKDHLWDPDRKNWGYGKLPETKEEYRQRYVKSLNRLIDFRRRGIAAGVYTQTTDVEGEVNGLLTYDRKVKKLSAEELAELHRALYEPLPADASAR